MKFVCKACMDPLPENHHPDVLCPRCSEEAAARFDAYMRLTVEKRNLKDAAKVTEETLPYSKKSA